MDPADYCRHVESYLCRKNDGHLIRVVGPAFEQVTGWCARGIPLKAVFRGIDRYFERYYAKGPRRRPVRIEFCEADVLDVFDDWRRAVGILDASPDGAAEIDARERRRPGLPTHLDRVVARLTALRAGAGVPRAFDEALDRVVLELDGLRTAVNGLRGEARARALARLAEVDADLLARARAALAPEHAQALRQEALEELAPFRERMPRDAFEQAVRASVDRLVRERVGLPRIALD